MKNFIPDFIQEKFKSGEEHGYFQGFAMFVDLSGFTILTQTLMSKGTEGAEQLSSSLNNIFAPLVQLVYQQNGFIPYFAGDAFTAIFRLEDLNNDPQKFIRIASTLNDSFSKKSVINTSFGDFHIGVKIGLAFGEIEWGIVGSKHKSFYFRGMAIEESARSQLFAGEQDIVIHESLLRLFPENTIPVKQLEEKDQFLLGAFPLLLEEGLPIAKPKKLEKQIVANFLPDSVLNFDDVGEFRTVIAVFISFTGIDNHDLMNRFASIVLDQINEFAGYFKEVDFGDKGGVLLGFFGAPVSYENNIERALEFILSVKEQVLETLDTNVRFKTGITSGLSYTGIVGGAERCQYAAVGNSVNLAARLMSKATWGETLVDDELSKHKHFRFEHKGDITYKGIKGNIPTYNLLGRAILEESEFSGEMIGREKELHSLNKFAQPISQNHFAGIARVYGEAGIGKSRLTYEFRNHIRESNTARWTICQADQILKKPFNPFIYLLKDLFKQSNENTVAENKAHFFENHSLLVKTLQHIAHPESESIHKELERTQSVLAALLGLKMENAIWDQLDARGRYQNTLIALDNFFRALAIIKPIIIELEDAHWFDNSSKDFLNSFSRKMMHYPILILVTSRYLDNGSKPQLFKLSEELNAKIPQLEIDLNTLNTKALKVFATIKLNGPLDDEFLQLLRRTTNGNPFYAEQILEYFQESKLLEQIDNAWHIKDKNVKLSTSINAILMARIDRLSALVKETVKAAAVIGREFEVPVLSEVMKTQELFQRRNGNTSIVLKEQIQKAERGQIWRAVNELKYIFKHSLLRETVYDMQLRTRLRELHRLIGEAIENLYADHIEERYVDLAYHFEQAGNSKKMGFYLKKAAQFSMRNFQNDRAIYYFDKLLQTKIAPTEKIKFLLRKAGILQLIGRWETAEIIFLDALSRAEEQEDVILKGRAQNQIGKLFMLKGAYSKATPYLMKAVDLFEEIQDVEGIARALGNLGDLYFRQGKYDKAKSFFSRSIKMTAEHNTRSYNAQIVSNLGLTHMNQGNYQEGIKVQQQQLDICRSLDDKQGMASLYTNLGIVYSEKGDYDEALASFEKGLELSEMLGNKLLTAIAIGCIGSVYQSKGDYTKAMELFEKDLKFCEELGDQQGISIACGLVGELLNIMGNLDEASTYLLKMLDISEKLSYQKGIAKALNALGDVYVNRQDYPLAVEYYERAITVSKAINNKLVLGFSIVEKAMVLCELEKWQEAESLLEKAQKIAKKLGQPRLIFETNILQVYTLRGNGQTKKAGKLLDTLLENSTDTSEQADVYYELYKTFPQDKFSRNKALELYETLFEDTPQFKFKQRITELNDNISQPSDF